MASQDDTERLERLIASNEAAANAMNRLAQVLERKERKVSSKKAPRVRPAVRPPKAATVSAQDADRATACARAALARLGLKG